MSIVPIVVDRMFDNITDTYESCIEIVIKKNEDYSSSHTDPFKNIKNSALIVGVTVEQAILVRIMDKITRISNLLNKPPAVTEESLDDSIKDAINYLAILKAYRDEQKLSSQSLPGIPLSELPIVEEQSETPETQVKDSKEPTWIESFINGLKG